LSAAATTKAEPRPTEGAPWSRSHRERAPSGSLDIIANHLESIAASTRAVLDTGMRWTCAVRRNAARLQHDVIPVIEQSGRASVLSGSENHASENFYVN